jgi:hypothetical protein
MIHYDFSKAPWFIGAPERNLGKGPGLPVETAYFRIAFAVKGKGVLRATVSASSRYCLYVNGVPVNHGPCKGDRMRHYCDDLDLGDFLRDGPNVIACKVVSFPPQEAQDRREVYADAGPASVTGTASGPCLLFAGELTDESGAGTDLSTGYAPWFVQNDAALLWLHPAHTMVFCHEEVDAKKIPPAWNKGGETGGGFVPAIRRWTYDDRSFGEISPLPLFRRPIPLLEEIEKAPVRELPVEVPGKKTFSFVKSREPEELTLAPHGKYSLDLDAGELTTAYVVLECAGGDDAEITLTYAESYGGPFTGGIRGNRMDHGSFSLGGFKDIYRPSGARERYEFFWFRTFRIIRLEILTGSSPLVLFPLKFRETGYPLEAISAPLPPDNGQADDPASAWVPALWDISLRTLRRCMHETYEDCPYYEQMQYTFDTRLQILFHYYLTCDTRLALKTIEDFHVSILPEGIIQSRYPNNSPQVIPTFSISWFSMLLDYYELTGDISVLERYRPTAEAIILWFKRRKNPRGFIENLGYWDFIDWAPEWNGIHGSVRASRHGPSTIQNLMYVYGLELLGKITGILGLKDLTDRYLDEARQTRTLIRSQCWDDNRGLFREGPSFDREWTQHAQIWAVLTGTVPAQKAAALMERTISDPDLIRCTFPLKFYLFRALEAANLYEKTEAQWDDWKRLLPLDLSTVPETPYDNSRSDCHAWSSLLLYEYPAKILGVYPVEPGYGLIGIKPRGLFLRRARGRVCTPAGITEVSWTYREGDFSINGTIPPGGRGLLTLPNGNIHEIGEGAFAFSCRMA